MIVAIYIIPYVAFIYWFNVLFLFIVDSSKASSRNEMPPKDAAQQLLQYLDIFYPNGVSINTVFNIERNTAPEYKPEVNMFFETVIGTYAEDCNYKTLETYKMTLDANKIATANWTEIKQMLTCLAGAERISYYNHAHAIESGRIKWILLRLKQLVEQ